MYNNKNSQLQHMGVVPSISFKLIEVITNNFADERILGAGGYGVVYKGISENGKEIAVKKLQYMPGLADKQFQNEIQNLMRAQHKNIVRLVGYSEEEQEKKVEYEGNLVIAREINRAICLEYVHNGSLQKHLTDESCGLDWPTRYKIIKGISEGLKYLHTGLEHPIYHLDLKPDNILLDENMIPKIADFGLSRLFAGTRQSRTTEHLIGTFGYMPPEYIFRNHISKKNDVFSLGVIIIEIITGPKGQSKIDNMSPEKFIELVHENWKKRLQAELMHASLEVYGLQVKRCIEIALKCMENEKDARPSIGDITRMMDITETLTGQLTNELLDVNPSELRFPFEQNKSISCLLQLTNKTNDRVVFQLVPTRPRRYLANLLCGIVPPRSTYTLTVTMKEHQQPPTQVDKFLMLASSIVGEIELAKGTSPETAELQYNKLFREVEEKGIQVHERTLVSVCDRQIETNSELIHPGIKMISYEQHGTVLNVDVHPMEPWTLTGHNSGKVCIWNHQTQEMMNTFEVSQRIVWAAKFIAREEWFVAGDIAGFIHVYSYRTMRELRRFNAYGTGITSFAIHPTKPYLVSASSIGQLTLWNWENGWERDQIFEGHLEQIYGIAFDPNDANSFATASWDMTVKIWSIGSRAASFTLAGHSDKVGCVNYFTCGDQHYLITGSHDCTAKIWDLETLRCVKTLGGHAGHVNSVCSHPWLPMLITGSWDWTVFLWDSNTFGLLRILNFALGIPRAVQCLEGSIRVVMGHATGLAAVEIDHAVLSANNESRNVNTIRATGRSFEL